MHICWSMLPGLMNTTADILMEDQLWPSLDMVAVDQEQELHKTNS